MRSVGCSAASQATATVSRCCGGSSCGQGRSSSHCHRDWNPSCGTSPSTMGRAVPAADSPCCWCGGGAWSSTGGCCSVDVDGGGCGSTSVAELYAASVGLAGNGTLLECLPKKLTNRSSARFFHIQGLGPPEPRPSNILPSTTPKASKSRFAHTRRAAARNAVGATRAGKRREALLHARVV